MVFFGLLAVASKIIQENDLEPTLKAAASNTAALFTLNLINDILSYVSLSKVKS